MTDDVAWKVYPPFFRFFRFFRSATGPVLTRAQQRDKGRPADLSQFLQAYAKMYPPFFRFFRFFRSATGQGERCAPPKLLVIPALPTTVVRCEQRGVWGPPPPGARKTGTFGRCPRVRV
jgi:hypothetical protein